MVLERRDRRRTPVLGSSGEAPGRVTRGELILLAFCLACAVVSLLGRLGAIELDGLAPLGLYPLYIVAASAGWINGNVFVARRRRGLPLWWMLAVYYLGPLAPLTLLRSMATSASQDLAPLVPLFSAGVFTVFFLVPWSLRSTAAVRRDLTFLRDEIDDENEDGAEER